MNNEPATRFDIVGFNQKNELILAVEAKSRLNVSLDWAMDYRLNLCHNQLLGDLKFFLLAFPDQFYLWKNHQAATSMQPAFVYDAKPVLSKYFQQSHINPSTISGVSFEMISKMNLNYINAN